MQRPNLYETVYAHDRRVHRHRCQRCSRIVNAGEKVVMYAVSKATRVLHADCADVMTCDGITYRQLAQLHSDEHARRLGFKVAREGCEVGARITLNTTRMDLGAAIPALGAKNCGGGWRKLEPAFVGIEQPSLTWVR